MKVVYTTIDVNFWAWNNLIFFKEKKCWNPHQTPLNKAPSKGGKERTQRGKDLSMSQKSKLQSRSQRGVKEQIMFHSPHQSQEAYEKEKAMENLK
jgi:hypothetical protein